MKKGFIYYKTLLDNIIIGYSDPKNELEYYIYDSHVKDNIYKFTSSQAREFIKKHHYSKGVVSNSFLHIGVYYKKELVGVLSLGWMINKHSCVNIHKDFKDINVIELNRMAFKDNLPRCIKSMSLSVVFKILKHTKPYIKCVNSFSDDRCLKKGVVYQSSNFCYYGSKLSQFLELDNKIYTSLTLTKTYTKIHKELYLPNKDKFKKIYIRQYRYIYWLDKKYKKDCLLTEEKYPKQNITI